MYKRVCLVWSDSDVPQVYRDSRYSLPTNQIHKDGSKHVLYKI